MVYKAIFLSILLCSTFDNCYCQFNLLNKNNGLLKLRIYLGADKDSKFTSDQVMVSRSNDQVQVSFLGYKTYGVSLLNTISKTNDVIDGLIIPSYSISKSQYIGQAVFGNETDSCTIDFRERLVKDRNGKSALISVLNTISFFTESPNSNLTQPNPYHSTAYVQKAGTLTVDFNSSDYVFIYKRSTGSNNCSGWLALSGDTLLIKIPPTQVTHKGKRISTKHLKYDPGIIIVKEDRVYGALDFGEKPIRVYILNELSEMEKMKIAAYMFTVVSEL